MNSNALDLVVATVLTAVFGLIISWQNYKLSQKVRTNHGKNIGEHLEEVGLDVKAAAVSAEAAKVATQLVALELSMYKTQQAQEADKVKLALDNNDNTFKVLLAAHTNDDLRNFSEMRSLLIQGLTGTKPEPPS